MLQTCGAFSNPTNIVVWLIKALISRQWRREEWGSCIGWVPALGSQSPPPKLFFISPQWFILLEWATWVQDEHSLGLGLRRDAPVCTAGQNPPKSPESLFRKLQGWQQPEEPSPGWMPLWITQISWPSAAFGSARKDLEYQMFPYLFKNTTWERRWFGIKVNFHNAKFAP